MDVFQKTISNLIESQFPDFYRTDGEMFVIFAKEYYRWMESQDQAIYHARRMSEYLDIDETVDDFIVHFKEQYLKNIQLETNTNTRQLIKHSLDLYRSKGTERSIALLFALVFGEDASVYYPRVDIFRLSDGTWIRPRYVEITPRAVNRSFVGKQMRGVKSGATAFVERLIRRRFQGKFAEIFYISALRGNFLYDEPVVLAGMNASEGPRLVGSLTTLDVLAGGSGFEVGDLVTLESNNGVQGIGRVAEVSSVTGIVSFELVDGGWGFSTNAETLISQHVVTVANVTTDVATNLSRYTFPFFETIRQPMARLAFNYANNTFANGESIFVYNGGGVVQGQGTVLSVETSSANANNGNLVVAILSGNLNYNSHFYTTANAKTGNTVALGYSDITATGNVMGISSNLIIELANVSGTIDEGLTAYQVDGLGERTANAFVLVVDASGSNATIQVTNSEGVFTQSRGLVFGNSSTTANITSFTLTIGTIGETGAFSAQTGNYLYGPNSNTKGTITRLSSGTLADFSVANTLLYTETSNLNTDFLRTYANVELDAAVYGFPAAPGANLTINTIAECLSFTTLTVGTIGGLTGINPGHNYDTAPFVLVLEPAVYSFGKQDYELTINNTVGSFSLGELVQQTQGANTVAGIVKAGSNSSVLFLKRLSILNEFMTSNGITGVFSSATANVTAVGVDANSLPIGLNAIVLDETQSGTGSVSALEVYDSGYGYIPDETVTFVDDEGNAGSARVNLLNQGTGSGYWRSKRGFLSADKKIYDGYYYQDFSYEVISSVGLDKYRDMLKQVLHPAGFIFFGSVVQKSVVDASIGDVSSSITIS